MFDKFGEFDSCEELNRAAAAQKKERDEKALLLLAEENGIEKEEAEDYLDDMMPELATPLMAAIGKLEVEAKDLKLGGVLMDWKDTIVGLCTENENLQIAVRRKGKNLKDCIASMIRFSFANKVQVSEKVVKATKITRNGKKESLKGPLYLGVPNRSEVKQLVLDYYLGGAK